MFTETGSSLAIGADSEMDVIVSDTGADFVERAALDTSALEPEPELQRELQPPMILTETSTTKNPAPREKKVELKKIGKKPSKRQRMLSGEKESATPMAASGLTGPESTQGSEIVVVETDTPPYTLSRRNTSIRQSAHTALLLLSTSRSKQRE